MASKSENSFDPEQVLPAKGRETIFEKIRNQWEFREGFFPVPKFKLSCPDCDGTDFYLRHLGAGKKKGTPNPFRMEPEFVCKNCCHRFIKSLTVPKEVYQKFREEAGHASFSQSELNTYIEETLT